MLPLLVPLLLLTSVEGRADGPTNECGGCGHVIVQKGGDVPLCLCGTVCASEKTSGEVNRQCVCVVRGTFVV